MEDPPNPKPKPTNRSKYENKPTPATPKSPASSSKSIVNPRVQIQPATPFVRTSRDRQNAKNRAVTDPVMPQPLFTILQKAKNPQQSAAPQERTIYGTENVVDVKDELSRQQLPSPLSRMGDAVSDYPEIHPAAHQGGETIETKHPLSSSTINDEVLELQKLRRPVHDNDPGNEITTSALPTFSTPNTYRSSSDIQSTGPGRHPLSTPIATRRYHLEKGLPAPPLRHEVFPPSDQLGYRGPTKAQGSSDTGGMILGDGILNPTRAGTYARLGAVEYVDQGQRVVSQVGEIEGSDYHGTSDECGPPGSTVSQGPSSLGSMQYAPSNLDRVCEKNPPIGEWLPHYSLDQSPSNVEVSMPDHRPPPHQASFNAHAPVSRGNSYGSTNPSLVTGFLYTPSHYTDRNVAPTPPRSYPGFQQSGPMSAELSQLETKVHDHIDNSINGLAGSLTDKLDRLGDQLAFRSDSFKENFVTGVGKNLKHDIKDMKKDNAARNRDLKTVVKDISVIKEDMKEGFNDIKEGIKEGFDGIGEVLRAVSIKLSALEERFEEGIGQLQLMDAETTSYDADRQAPPRRTESADASFGRGEQHIQPRGIQSSTGGRHSSRGRRQMNDGLIPPTDPDAKRQFFIEMTNMAGAPPDIAQHPAYRGMPHGRSLSTSQGPQAAAAASRNKENAPVAPPNYRKDWWKHDHQN